MAMTKKEKAEFAAMKRAVLIGRALNWSERVLPDVLPPKSGDNHTLGFWVSASSNEVFYARSSSIQHAISRTDFPKQTTSQRAICMYSTKLLALKALRHEVEKECARRLAEIDEQIEAIKGQEGASE